MGKMGSICHFSRVLLASTWGRCSQILVCTSTWGTQKGRDNDTFRAVFPVSGYLGNPKHCKTRETQNGKLTLFAPIPRHLHCPWIHRCTVKALMGIRNAIISAIRPSLQRSARSQVITIIHCLKGHALDPLLAQIKKLLLSIINRGPDMVHRVEIIEGQAPRFHGPLSVAASVLHDLGIYIQEGKLQMEDCEPLPPTEQQRGAEWQHQLRDRLRLAIVRPGVDHRKAFQQVLNKAVNWPNSLAFLREIEKEPQKRTALELVLTDGLLTLKRTAKTLPSEARRCPYGCRPDDSPCHRFWMCRRWSPSRSAWKLDTHGYSELLRKPGLALEKDGVTRQELNKIQTWMALVVAESAQDSCWEMERDAVTVKSRRTRWVSRREGIHVGHLGWFCVGDFRRWL